MSDFAMADSDTLTDPERRAYSAMTKLASVTAAQVGDAAGVADSAAVLRTLVARGLVLHDPREDSFSLAAPSSFVRRVLQDADDQLGRTRTAIADLLDTIPH